MRILHLDAGREMRGGQWQVVRLIRGLAAEGLESTLLARRDTPLYLAARKEGWRVEPFGPARALALAGRHDLVHAHDARSHTLAAFAACAAGGFAPRGLPGPLPLEIRAARAGTWRCRSSSSAC